MALSQAPPKQQKPLANLKSVLMHSLRNFGGVRIHTDHSYAHKDSCQYQGAGTRSGTREKSSNTATCTATTTTSSSSSIFGDE